MATHWSAETIHSELHTVAQHIEKPVSAYLVGGSAMVVQGYKERTPDVDLVVPSDTEFNRLQHALTEVGYECTLLKQDTDDTFWMCQFENEAGSELDIFNTQIGDGLILSDGIRRRSAPYITTAAAEISVIRPEDIYLSKLVHSGRVKDAPDTTALSATALDFDVINEELRAQNELADGTLPSTLAFGQTDKE